MLSSGCEAGLVCWRVRVLRQEEDALPVICFLPQLAFKGGVFSIVLNEDDPGTTQRV